ncbi:uncharacterized protein LOC100898167 [Galendromus occidentalis]|uniref:Uncharacterized protein LOC100898167 n=1 Tax=Galendromus occidentalis TaxID=34638 RepID=A0AAJ6QR02_9ACAR|nr:uncharacterized protein LOC100898167 [Galendromus occidentalis]
MGKERRIRKTARNNPLGTRRGVKTDTALPLTEELDFLKTKEATASLGFSLDELLQKLQSQVPDDRTSAAVILANLSSSPSTVDGVKRLDIIKFAAPLLLDKNIHVRLNISRFLGALGNTGHSTCDKLVEGGVMAIIGQVLARFIGCDWSKIDKSQNTVLADSLYLLEKLCESSAEAVEFFNKQNLIDVVLPLLSVELTRSFTISAAAGMCLLAVTEDNPELEERLRSEIPAIKGIITQSHASMSQIFMRAIGVALLYNLDDPNSDPSFQLEALKGVLETPSEQLSALVSEKIVKVTEIERARDIEVENLEKLHKEVDAHVSELSELLRAKKLALEVLTNWCCAGDDDDDDDGWEDDDSDGGSSQASIDETMDTGTNGEDTLSPEFMRATRVASLLPVILRQTVDLLPHQNESFKLSAATQNLRAEAEDVRCRAYLCIDNMFQRLRIEDFGGPDEVRLLFETLMKAMIEVCRADKDLFEVISSALRGILDCILRTEKSRRPNVMSCVNAESLMMVCETSQKGRCASTKMNICRIVTTLALLEASLSPGAVEFLFVVATGDSDVRICAEAFDCIIDLFSGDDYDVYVREFQLVEKLRRALPNFRTMYRALGKGETKMLAVTCGKNLRRFIDYKARRRP